ncbi:uncharacterized protein LOC132803176 [Ziziphus jujuba]|uniref:Uncharacterized protein LOC132803176 n=1 Tax=Ziziphus jujuba TaxID=326968 RepID=A0ABM4A3X3_ZIZJJ|nr:uncharacterized protein LOC132803176 [Ziziphus jujuba]
MDTKYMIHKQARLQEILPTLDNGLRPQPKAEVRRDDNLPKEGVVHFGQRGKLIPRYIGPFEIVERIGPVAYRVDLPEELSRVHDVFHISMLRKYISDPSHVLKTLEIELRDDLSYEEQPVQILGREEKRLRNKTIALVKVLWRNQIVEESTW